MPEAAADPAKLDELAAASDGQGGTLLAALIDVLVREEAPACLAGFREALASGDATAFSRLAHRLKGSALVFGASRLAELCLAAETGASPATAETLRAIEGELAALESALQARR
jgi:HPt (histidine-containing phosphotransfer) domain-containing protein